MPEYLVLNLKQQELEFIANVLAQRPYAEVALLMQNIQSQVQAQQAQPNGHALAQGLQAVQ